MTLNFQPEAIGAYERPSPPPDLFQQPQCFVTAKARLYFKLRRPLEKHPTLAEFNAIYKAPYGIPRGLHALFDLEP